MLVEKQRLLGAESMSTRKQSTFMTQFILRSYYENDNNLSNQSTAGIITWSNKAESYLQGIFNVEIWHRQSNKNASICLTYL